MASITDKLKKTITALDAKQLKRALSITDTPKLDRQHEMVVEAANICLADKGKCDGAIKVARDKVKATTDLPEDSTDIEGLEEYLKPRETMMVTNTGENVTENAIPVTKETGIVTESASSITPERPCDVCMIAGAVGKFGEISDGCDGEVRKQLEVVGQDNMTLPEKWMQTMAEIAEGAICNKEAYVTVLSGLTDELEKMDSPILKNMESEG
jgi:hypothetical protein